jgi:hypothetical protein
MSLDGLRALPSGLEAYYNDHFGFRKRLIRWERKWKRSWFREAGRAEVLIGRDGWLYFADKEMIDNFRAARLFAPAELAGWQALLEQRRDWLAQRGIKYLFVVPPDKQTIYPEHLPEWLTRVGPQTKLDQFFAHMRAHSTVPVLDLRPALRAAKSTFPTYHNTDSHWNRFGAFVAYQEVIRALAAQLPGIEPLPATAFDITLQRHPCGDLSAMLGQEPLFPETSWVEMTLRPPRQHLPIRAASTNAPETYAALYTENPAQSRHLLMYRDSYGTHWLPFFGHSFQRATFLWQSGSRDLSLIEREHPDVVVDEMLERNLYGTDPNQLRQHDHCP